jgi:hypothetical protein
MKKYLVTYHSDKSAQDVMAKATPEQAKAGMDAWMTWAKKSGQSIVDLGAPVGNAFAVNAKAPSSKVGGFSIVQAADTNSAKKLFAEHPHLMVPGNSIEVHEYLSMPGM